LRAKISSRQRFVRLGGVFLFSLNTIVECAHCVRRETGEKRSASINLHRLTGAITKISLDRIFADASFGERLCKRAAQAMKRQPARNCAFRL
jgi:hypothetical protein